MRFRTLAVVAVVAVAMLYSAVSEARPGRRGGNFGRKMLMGVDFDLVAGGEWKFDATNSVEEFSDMEVGFGFDAYFEYQVMRYFRAGLQIGVLWVRNEYWEAVGRDRMWLLDMDVRFRIPFLLWRDKVMCYLQIPIGFTMANPDDDTPVSLTQVAIADTGYGMNVGGLIGAQFFLAPRIAVHINVGVLYHWWEWESQAAALSGTAEPDTENSFAQFYLQVGFGYAM